MAEAFTAYGLQVIAGLIALFALWKDWEEYPDGPRSGGRQVKSGLTLATVIVVVLSVADTRFSRKSSSEDKATLNTQIDQLRNDSEPANDGFRQSFAGLYDKFSQLQTRVQTDALTKQNSSLLKEIDETKQDPASQLRLN